MTQKFSQYLFGIIFGVALPQSALAQEQFAGFDLEAPSMTLIVVSCIFGILLLKLIVGILNMNKLEEQSLATIEKEQTTLPNTAIINGLILCGIFGALLLLFTDQVHDLFKNLHWRYAFALLSASYCVILLLRWKNETFYRSYLYAGTIATIIAFALIIVWMFLLSLDGRHPGLVVLSVVVSVVMWYILFSGKRTILKIIMLTTCLTWWTIEYLTGLHADRVIIFFAALFLAQIFGMLWLLILHWVHPLPRNTLIFSILGGALAPLPLLLYRLLAEKGHELSFVVARVIPEPIHENLLTGELFVEFVRNQNTLLMGVLSLIALVILEEGSKWWILARGEKTMWRNRRDIIMMGMLVALGFSLAENVMNPHFFMAFIQHDLLVLDNPQWHVLIGKLTGRGVVATLTHIVATSILAYYIGLSKSAQVGLLNQKLFASKLADGLQWLFLIPKQRIIRSILIWQGFFLSVFCHTIFNGLITLASILAVSYPDQPSTRVALVSGTAIFLVTSWTILRHILQKTRDGAPQHTSSSPQSTRPLSPTHLLS